jgi:hypothetical protein
MSSPPPQFLMGYVHIVHLFSLFLNCLSMFSVYLEFTSSPVFDGFRVAHIFSLFFTCPMLAGKHPLSFEIWIFRNGQPDRNDDNIIFAAITSTDLILYTFVVLMISCYTKTANENHEI